MGKLRIKFNFEKFDTQIRDVVRKFENTQRSAMMFAVANFFRFVTEMTPIKTGSMRLNWHIGVGSPSHEQDVRMRIGDAFGTDSHTYKHYIGHGEVYYNPQFLEAFNMPSESVTLREALDIIKNSPLGTKVYISNSTSQNGYSYIMNAEQYGWKIRGAYKMGQLAMARTNELVHDYLSHTKLGAEIGNDFTPFQGYYVSMGKVNISG